MLTPSKLSGDKDALAAELKHQTSTSKSKCEANSTKDYLFAQLQWLYLEFWFLHGKVKQSCSNAKKEVFAEVVVKAGAQGNNLKEKAILC
jgi:hypothetical protein